MDTELRAALPKRACGVPFHPRSLRTIRELIHSLSGASRQQIIRQCCEHLGWSDYQGQAKVTAARSVLLSFHERGWIELPAARAVKRTSPSSSLPSGYEPIQIQLPLHQLQGITLRTVTTKSERHLWRGMMEHYHYLGGPRLFGAQLRYLVESEQGVLGAMSFSAAAGRLRERDHWIGWSGEQRRIHRHLLLNNSRFLILPGVQVPNLASHLLAKAARQLPADFEQRYGYRPLLLESFVEQGRYQGTCYRAANWIKVGQTSGRGRSDRRTAAQQSSEAQPLPIKSIWLYPLCSTKRLHTALCQPAATSANSTNRSALQGAAQERAA